MIGTSRISRRGPILVATLLLWLAGSAAAEAQERYQPNPFDTKLIQELDATYTEFVSQRSPEDLLVTAKGEVGIIFDEKFEIQIPSTDLKALLYARGQYVKYTEGLAQEFESIVGADDDAREQRLAGVRERAAHLRKIQSEIDALNEQRAPIEHELAQARVPGRRPVTGGPPRIPEARQKYLNEKEEELGRLHGEINAKEAELADAANAAVREFPELAVHVDGVPLWTELAGLFPDESTYEQYVDKGARDMREEAARARAVTDIDGLKEFGAYQNFAAGVAEWGRQQGSDLPGSLMTAAAGLAEEADADKAVTDAWWDLGLLSVALVGAMFTAGGSLGLYFGAVSEATAATGTAVGTGICLASGVTEVAKEGVDLASASGRANTAERAAPVVGLEEVETASRRRRQAWGRLTLAVVFASLDIPALRDALRARSAALETADVKRWLEGLGEVSPEEAEDLLRWLDEAPASTRTGNATDRPTDPSVQAETSPAGTTGEADDLLDWMEDAAPSDDDLISWLDGLPDLGTDEAGEVLGWLDDLPQGSEKEWREILDWLDEAPGSATGGLQAEEFFDWLETDEIGKLLDGLPDPPPNDWGDVLSWMDDVDVPPQTADEVEDLLKWLDGSPCADRSTSSYGTLLKALKRLALVARKMRPTAKKLLKPSRTETGTAEAGAPASEVPASTGGATGYEGEEGDQDAGDGDGEGAVPPRAPGAAAGVGAPDGQEAGAESTSETGGTETGAVLGTGTRIPLTEEVDPIDFEIEPAPEEEKPDDAAPPSALPPRDAVPAQGSDRPTTGDVPGAPAPEGVSYIDPTTSAPLLNSPFTAGSVDPTTQPMMLDLIDLELGQAEAYVQPSPEDRATVPGHGGAMYLATDGAGGVALVQTVREARKETSRTSAGPDDPPVTAFLTSLGVSTGEAFDLVALNEGDLPVRITGDGIVVEPVQLKDEAKRQLQSSLSELASRNPVTAKLNAYCLEFLARPPTAGQLFRIASTELQQEFAPMRNILKAGRQVFEGGLLNPDSDPIAYMHSIKQWALWSHEKGFDLGSFQEAFLEHTKKNFEAAGRSWNGDVEDAVRAVLPNRWNDIQKVLTAADESGGVGAGD